MAGVGTWALSDAIGSGNQPKVSTVYATVKRVDDDGTAWVTLGDGAGEFPATGNTAEINPGDRVSVRIQDGTATIGGNVSDPSVGETRVLVIERKADDALTEASRAHAAADAAETDAARAATAADAAEADAQRAATSASNAETSASQAATSASNAATSAGNAASSASTAQAQASAATTAANEAKADAKTAKDNAAQAVSDAATAKQAATDATTTANGAVTALATVQGVVDQLETDVDELQVHVAMMDAYSDGHGGTVPAGLHVVPTGSGYFLVIANDGTYVYDAQSVLVTKFGESIDFSSTRPQRIGNETAYVEYYDSDNDGVPDSIRIKADSITLGGTSVADKLSTQGYSVEIAATATDTASGAVTLTATVRKDGAELTAAEVLRVGCVKWYRADTGARVGAGLTLAASAGVRYLARLEG